MPYKTDDQTKRRPEEHSWLHRSTGTHRKCFLQNHFYTTLGKAKTDNRDEYNVTEYESYCNVFNRTKAESSAETEVD